MYEWSLVCFNPFQGIWEFRHQHNMRLPGDNLRFQSLPGNLGVPALPTSERNLYVSQFQSLPGNLGVPAQEFVVFIKLNSLFQSLPGNLGVPAIR